MNRPPQWLENAEAVGQLVLIMVLPLILIDILFTYNTTLQNLNSQNKAWVGIVLYIILVFVEVSISSESNDRKTYKRRK